MSNEQEQKIDWTKSLKQFATVVWGISTYLALLIGAALLAVAAGGKHPVAVAIAAVFNATWINWMAFTAIERRLNKR